MSGQIQNEEFSGAKFAPGDIAFGKFNIQGLLGSGNMGVVYKAEDTVLARIVALKVLSKLTLRERDIRRFQNESKIASRLNHPNIAKVYDFGRAKSGELYMSMAFVEGKTLSQILEKEGKLPVIESLEIMVQILSALESAHDMGIIHRDIKPANIMLEIVQLDDQDGHVMLLDFGVAKHLNDDTGALTTPGRIIGSPFYMSPEQSSANPVGAPSDIYSLGCVLFECLTGHAPFEEESVMETLVAHQEKLPPLAELDRLSGPLGLTPLLAKMLGKDCAQRGSAREIREAMEQLLDSMDQEDLKDRVKSNQPEVKSENQSFEKKGGQWLSWAIAGLLLAGAGSIFLVVRNPAGTAGGGRLRRPEITNVVREGIRTKSNIAQIRDDILSSNEKLNLKVRNLRDSDLVNIPNTVIKVDLIGNEYLTDVALERLKSLKLQELFLGNTKVKTLDALATQTDLRSLDLSDTAIGDNSLKNISHLDNLETLDLSSTHLTPEAVIRYIPQLKKLRILALRECEDIDDETMEQLALKMPLCIVKPYRGEAMYITARRSIEKLLKENKQKQAFNEAKRFTHLVESQYGSNCRQLPELYLFMSTIAKNMGDNETHSHLLHKLTTSSEFLSLDPTSVALAMEAAILHYILQRQSKAVVSVFPRWIKLCSREFGESSMKVSELYIMAGVAYREVGRIENARDFFEKSLNIRRQILQKQQHSPKQSAIELSYSASLLGLGETHFALGEYTRALEESLEVLAIRERLTAPDSFAIIEARNLQVSCLMEFKRLDEADRINTRQCRPSEKLRKQDRVYHADLTIASFHKGSLIAEWKGDLKRAILEEQKAYQLGRAFAKHQSTCVKFLQRIKGLKQKERLESGK